ncbi:hypothetical protein ACFQJ8_00745 [Halocatena marina]|uniref:hypothetical protein n=1 Tax=Halocatena marina TaxID=2934937 RepID=UPI00361291D2
MLVRVVPIELVRLDGQLVVGRFANRLSGGLYPDIVGPRLLGDITAKGRVASNQSLGRVSGPQHVVWILADLLTIRIEEIESEVFSVLRRDGKRSEDTLPRLNLDGVPIYVTLFDCSIRSSSDIDGRGGCPAVVVVRATDGQHTGG